MWRLCRAQFPFRSCDGDATNSDWTPWLSGLFMPTNTKVDAVSLVALTKTNVRLQTTWQRTPKRKKMTAAFEWRSGNSVFLNPHLLSDALFRRQCGVLNLEAGPKCSDVQTALLMASAVACPPSVHVRWWGVCLWDRRGFYTWMRQRAHAQRPANTCSPHISCPDFQLAVLRLWSCLFWLLLYALTSASLLLLGPQAVADDLNDINLVRVVALTGILL